MQFDWPETYLSEQDWGVYVRAKMPALAKLWDAEEHEKYNTLITLYQLTYENFKNRRRNTVYAQYIPIMRQAMPKMLADDLVSVQPMTKSAGEIFNIKSKKRA